MKFVVGLISYNLNDLVEESRIATSLLFYMFVLDYTSKMYLFWDKKDRMWMQPLH